MVGLADAQRQALGVVFAAIRLGRIDPEFQRFAAFLRIDDGDRGAAIDLLSRRHRRNAAVGTHVQRDFAAIVVHRQGDARGVDVLDLDGIINVELRLFRRGQIEKALQPGQFRYLARIGDHVLRGSGDGREAQNSRAKESRGKRFRQK